MSNLDELIKLLKDSYKNSTPVNGWYAHQYEGEVRGPYNRWFRVVGPLTEERQNNKIVRADASLDVVYAANAMTNLPIVITAYESALTMLDEMAKALERASGEYEPKYVKDVLEAYNKFKGEG